MRAIPECSLEKPLEALWSCLDNGVVKAPQAMSEMSLHRIASRLTFGSDDVIVADGVIDAIPELGKFNELLLTQSNILAGLRCYLFPITQNPFAPNMSEKAHQDEITSKNGLSWLFPVAGDEALFAAAKTSFEMSADVFDPLTCPEELPEFLGTYGVGDGLLMRQDIEWVNGQNVILERLYHCGAGSQTRHIASVDFVFDSIAIPDLQEAAGVVR